MLPHFSVFRFSRPIAMVDFSVMFEEGKIIYRCFNAQDEGKLIIHFNRYRSHMMFDARSEDS